VKCIMLILFYIKVKTNRFCLLIYFISYVDISPSIGTPPRLIQPPLLNDARLIIPSLTQTTNNKWDPLSLSDGSFSIDFRSYHDF
jgi:hypothetical protein